MLDLNNSKYGYNLILVPKKTVAEEKIVDYIRNLPGAQDDEDILQLDGAKVLNSVEAQHGLLVERARGIYSFSHLTFQEYFTAKQITQPEAQLHDELGKLTVHITEKRYRDIFLLTVEMLPKADDLLMLMKQHIDTLLVHELDLQTLLQWVYRKRESVNIPYKAGAIRAFYLVLDLALNLNLDLNLDRDCDLTLALALDPNLDLDLELYLYLYLDRYRPFDLNLDFHLYLACILAFDRDLALDRALDRAFSPELKLNLKSLKNQLPNIQIHSIWKQWCKTEGPSWMETLRSVMMKYRNIGHEWKFTDAQKAKLQQYYDANKLLVECLNSDCYVTKATRQEIEDTLLLPMSEIEKRKG
ncbi:MAG: hypothetical protein AAGF93_04315 [Cyanobacteria bacterium P01_H01_bin.105]